ncbi:alpha/beta-hydrolase [Basidiobolus meristosporus CBS 931.73]|uniref:Alpha/beta-hydrolase n=1 Tax=Basidiobolus meristosporus CBS 931.73 TaxID=1314790 RepID=A0A1Y1YG56_9FUNG|nr:alpha/beta-hydrolase [Basidiobolus meristosporus CBS 931.73]ORX96938.1 alpha/beta-hydrolase [Basidiobolus meristosporus CBS 931.73]|eukprot:ORX84724.1 alpha/beta-hydrolase [Basidiobolus meristosporus CBS 931.73]
METYTVSVKDTWHEHDGVTFYTKLFEVTPKPRATVTLIHGLGEHCDRYEELGKYLGERGIQVFTYDQRGFGKTGYRNPPLGHSGGFEKVLQDVDYFVERSSFSDLSVPHFLFGHSMGGMIVLNYGAVYSTREIAGIIASAPCIQAGKGYIVSGIQAKALGFLGSIPIINTLPIQSNIKAEHLSFNEKSNQEYMGSMYNFGYASLSCLSDIFYYGKLLLTDRYKNFLTPVLLTHGEQDQITSCAATTEFHDLLEADKTLKIWPNSAHELHFEDNKQEVMEYYYQWLDNKIHREENWPSLAKASNID